MRERAQRLGGADVFEVAGAQELGPDDADEGGPAEERGEEHQEPETSPEDREQDDDRVKLWHRHPDLDHALEYQVQPAAGATQDARPPELGRGQADEKAAHVWGGDAKDVEVRGQPLADAFQNDQGLQ